MKKPFRILLGPHLQQGFLGLVDHLGVLRCRLQQWRGRGDGMVTMASCEKVHLGMRSLDHQIGHEKWWVDRERKQTHRLVQLVGAMIRVQTEI